MRLHVTALVLPCVVLIGSAGLCGGGLSQSQWGQGFIVGADVSFLDQIEDSGGVYSEGGVAGDALEILRDHGFNYMRLRIWHSPQDHYCNLERTLTMARRIRDLGLGFLLDFHYSDMWADPGRQTKPAAWTDLPFEELKDSLYHYTRKVIAELTRRGTLPDMVQIGNEIACGMLWDDGRVCAPFDTLGQWANLAALIEVAASGVKDGLGADDSVGIVIHVDCGGDTARSRWFFDHLAEHGVDFDVIGLSYYPWWHGSIDDLSANLSTLAERYDKDIIIVETAYPWTLDWFDNTHNIVGLHEQIHPGYPASVDGQRRFLADLAGVISETPGGRGRGFLYWAPEYISTPALGSSWENVTLFDFRGRWLGSAAR